MSFGLLACLRGAATLGSLIVTLGDDKMNEKLGRHALAVALSVLVLACDAHAQGVKDCMPSLVRDNVSTSIDTATALILTDVMHKQLSSSDRQNIGGKATIYGTPYQVNSDRAKALSEQFSRQTGINYTDVNKVRILTSRLSDNAVDAFRSCISGAHEVGPRVYIYDANAEQATVKIVWKSAAQNKGDSDGIVTIVGGAAVTPFPTRWGINETRVSTVNRVPKQELRVTANIGGYSADWVAPYVPRVRATRSVSLVNEPKPPSFLRLANDGTGANQGPISDCYSAVKDAQIVTNSVAVKSIARAGNINDTSYVKITSETNSKVCWEAFLRPLSRNGGGDMQWRIQYQVETWSFSMD
jgi:hypothetical protein